MSAANLMPTPQKRKTTVFASFMKDQYERAIEIMSDITFNSQLPEKEIEKEKDVVIEEINSYLDSPAELIFDEFEEQIFSGQPIGHNILGTNQYRKILYPRFTGRIYVRKLQHRPDGAFAQWATSGMRKDTQTLPEAF